jgi:hypothetical protein
MSGSTIYTNPVGWARRVAGTRRRYLLVSAAVAAAGTGLLLMIVFTCTQLWIRLAGGFLTVCVAIEMPLYCLRAIRAFLTEGCSGKGRERGRDTEEE